MQSINITNELEINEKSTYKSNAIQTVKYEVPCFCLPAKHISPSKNCYREGNNYLANDPFIPFGDRSHKDQHLKQAVCKT